MARPTKDSWQASCDGKFPVDGVEPADSYDLHLHSDSGLGGLPDDSALEERGSDVQKGSGTQVWSSTQASVAMCTSGRSFLRAHAQQKDWAFRRLRCTHLLVVHLDACRCIGLGKTQHLEVRFWWVHEMFKAKRLEIGKVRCGQNLVDMLTKFRSAKEAAPLLVGGSVGGRGPRGPIRWADMQ